MVTYSFHEFQFTKIGVPNNQQMIPRKLVLRWRVKVSNWKHLCTLIKQSNQIWWFGKLCGGKAVELLFPICSWAGLTKKISEFFLGFLKKKFAFFSRILSRFVCFDTRDLNASWPSLISSSTQVPAICQKRHRDRRAHIFY